jgi:O-antigen/teichoic acid export membrane protein
MPRWTRTSTRLFLDRFLVEWLSLGHARPMVLRAAASGMGRGAIGVLAGGLVGAMAAFVARIVMARNLSPAELGDVTLAITLVSALGGVAALGTSASAAHWVALALAEGDRPRAESAARTACWMALGVGAVAGLLLWTVAPWVAQAVGRPALASVLRWLAPVATALAAGYAVLGLTRGFGDILGRAVIRDAGGGALRLACIALAVARGATASGVAAAFALGTLATELVFVLFAVVRGWLRRGVGWHRELVFGVGPFAAMGVLGQWALWSDVLLLGALAPGASVGLYGVARGVARLLEMVRDAAAQRFLPLASAAATDAIALAALYERTRALVCALLWPVAVPLVIAPETLLELCFGASYAAAAASLRVLALALLGSALLGYNDKTLIALGKSAAVSRAMAAAVLVGAALTLLLVPPLGSLGAAIGFAALVLVQSSLCALSLKPFGLRLGRGVSEVLGALVVPTTLVAAGAELMDADGILAALVGATVATLGSLVVVARRVGRPVSPRSGS